MRKLAFIVTVAVQIATAQPQRPAPAKAKPDSQVHILPVQGNIYMMVAGGVNLTMSIGKDGIFAVDTGPAQLSDQIMAAQLQLATAVAAAPMPNRCVGLRCPGTPFGWSSPGLNSVI